MVSVGQWNSSITRVRPVFQSLLKRDRSGSSWLGKLLACTPERSSVHCAVASNPRSLLDYVAKTRWHVDGGLPAVALEKAFEWPCPPPREFLRWLVQHPEKLDHRPKARLDEASRETRIWRSKLLGDDPEARKEAIDKATTQLSKASREELKKKRWWILEGTTFVDCCLETEKFLLFVEGKRTETASSSTIWYRSRHQVLRNLEAGFDEAEDRKKAFGLILITEGDSPVDEITEAEIRSSLPHMNDSSRKKLMEHYLGRTTWQQVCEATGLNYDLLPDTTSEVADCLRRATQWGLLRKSR